MAKNCIYLIMFIFLSQLLINSKKMLVNKKFESDPIADYEADKDPNTNYNQYYFENSLETFANAMFNMRKTKDDFQLCLIDNKFNAKLVSRKFLQAYNDLVNSIQYAKEHNKSVKINSDTVCVYSLNQDWKETENSSETHIRSIYIVPKRYFIQFFRSEFFSFFLKYMICIQAHKNYEKFVKLWRVLIYEKTYDQLFGNYCTISNIFHYIDKKINEKAISSPFYYLGNLLGTFFDKIATHLIEIAQQYDLDNI